MNISPANTQQIQQVFQRLAELISQSLASHEANSNPTQLYDELRLASHLKIEISHEQLEVTYQKPAGEYTYSRILSLSTTPQRVASTFGYPSAQMGAHRGYGPPPGYVYPPSLGSQQNPNPALGSIPGWATTFQSSDSGYGSTPTMRDYLLPSQRDREDLHEGAYARLESFVYQLYEYPKGQPWSDMLRWVKGAATNLEVRWPIVLEFFRQLLAPTLSEPVFSESRARLDKWIATAPQEAYRTADELSVLFARTGSPALDQVFSECVVRAGALSPVAQRLLAFLYAMAKGTLPEQIGHVVDRSQLDGEKLNEEHQFWAELLPWNALFKSDPGPTTPSVKTA